MKIKKKRDENQGWLQPPLGQKWGGLATPFLARGATPSAGLGVVRPPIKGKKKKKKTKNGLK
jgi:hypothetical protein